MKHFGMDLKAKTSKGAGLGVFPPGGGGKGLLGGGVRTIAFRCTVYRFALCLVIFSLFSRQCGQFPSTGPEIVTILQ